MTEILNELKERIYVANTKRYRLYHDITSRFPEEGTKFGIVAEVWNGERWNGITVIFRKTKKQAFDDAKAFLIAFHDGE